MNTAVNQLLGAMLAAVVFCPRALLACLLACQDPPKVPDAPMVAQGWARGGGWNIPPTAFAGYQT